MNLIRALLVAAVCAAMLAMFAAAASAQEAPPVGGGDVVAPDPGPPPAPPAPDPVPAPEPPVDPAPPEPPADPAPEPPADPAPEPPADPVQPAERHTDNSTPQRDDTARTGNSAPAAQSSVPAGSSDQFAPPAPLPGGGAGEDWAWTDQGDAFIVGTGGASGSGTDGALAHFTGAGSIATAARVPALGSRERAAHDAAQAYANGSALTLSDAGSGGLFAGLFGGGGSGAGGVLLLTVFGILAVFRLVRPDWNEAFRTSTATWRPSAYVPPIEHPG